MQDWDDAFSNMDHIEGSEALPGIWAKSAANYRNNVKIQTDISYGPDERHAFDLVLPEKQPKGLIVFVHGGFWMRLSKDYWTHYAKGARAHGWAVAIPSYTLTPKARINEITLEIATAITIAANHVPGPIRLIGHSAGGHLVTRMVSASGPLIPSVKNRIEHTISLSGLHDLRPLMHTKMNETLHIDEIEAISESPVLLRPIENLRLTIWVGGGERPEFIRQSKLLHNIWTGLDANSKLVIDAEHNHFTVLEGLRDENSNLLQDLLGA